MGAEPSSDGPLRKAKGESVRLHQDPYFYTKMSTPTLGFLAEEQKDTRGVHGTV